MQTTLDHILIAVADLEVAARDYSLLLGRTPSECTHHPELGTHSIRFQLDNTCIVLIASAMSKLVRTRDLSLH